jgi:hypothetical protein
MNEHELKENHGLPGLNVWKFWSARTSQRFQSGAAVAGSPHSKAPRLRESNVLNPSYPCHPWLSALCQFVFIGPAAAGFVVENARFGRGAGVKQRLGANQMPSHPAH